MKQNVLLVFVSSAFAQWLGYIRGPTNVSQMCEWMNCWEFVFAFTLKLILPMSQDCKTSLTMGPFILSPNAANLPMALIKSRPDLCCLWTEPGRWNPPPLICLLLSPWKSNREGEGGMKNDLRTTPHHICYGVLSLWQNIAVCCC